VRGDFLFALTDCKGRELLSTSWLTINYWRWWSWVRWRACININT